MSSMQTAEAVIRAKRIVNLFERKLITEASLVGEIASLITPENIRDVMRCLPPQVLRVVRDWAKTLPEDDPNRVIFWPLPNGVRLSFKEWLQEQERQEANESNGA